YIFPLFYFPFGFTRTLVKQEEQSTLEAPWVMGTNSVPPWVMGANGEAPWVMGADEALLVLGEAYLVMG
ncbi:unnamed protein product, partial [Ilex paraguariensis]